MNRLPSSTPRPSMIWNSVKEPKVTVDKLWVWPLVNNAEPWVLSKISTLEESGLISFTARPSGRILSFVINLLTSSARICSRTISTYFLFSSISCNDNFSSFSNISLKCSRVFSLTASIAASRANFSWVEIAGINSGSANSRILFSNSSGILNKSGTIFSLPMAFWISSWNSHKRLISSWANNNASSISSSLTCLAPASTMLIAFLVPATVKLISEFSNSSTVGLRTNFPLTLPTTTPAIGPWKGISDIVKAILEPSIAAIAEE